MTPISNETDAPGEIPLQVFLLGQVEFESALRLQRQLVYQASGDRNSAVLVVCEHPPAISVGRHGSRAHILYDADELRVRQWPVRWVNRGGGCILHLPGQLAIYSIVPLDRLQFGLSAYVDRLHLVLRNVLADFNVEARTRPALAGLWVGERPIARIGIAVRDWIAYYGAVLNVNPPLQPFEQLRGVCACDRPMTSLERERRGPLKLSMVRERLIEYFANAFCFARTSIFFEHPTLSRKAMANAVATGP